MLFPPRQSGCVWLTANRCHMRWHDNDMWMGQIKRDTRVVKTWGDSFAARCAVLWVALKTADSREEHKPCRCFFETKPTHLLKTRCAKTGHQMAINSHTLVKECKLVIEKFDFFFPVELKEQQLHLLNSSWPPAIWATFLGEDAAAPAALQNQEERRKKSAQELQEGAVATWAPLPGLPGDSWVTWISWPGSLISLPHSFLPHTDLVSP